MKTKAACPAHAKDGCIEVHPHQDKKSGRHTVECPQSGCKYVASAMTNHGVMATLCDHMNAFHFEPLRGNA